MQTAQNKPLFASQPPRNKSMNLAYIVNKKQYSIDSRDFVEKQFSLYKNGKFYRYSSTIP